MHGAYKKAKAKQDELWNQLKERENEIQELQSRYEEKSRQKQHLEGGSTGHRPSLGGVRTVNFQGHTAPMMPQSGGRIDTRLRAEPEIWMKQQNPLLGKSRQSSELRHEGMPNRAPSITRSFDSGLTPPTASRESRERAFRPLSPYTRQASDLPQHPGRDPALFSKRRVF